MRQLQPVIWSKGTFLSPQHLQAQERFVEDSIHFYLQSMGAAGWGFLQLQLDARALAAGTLSLSAASGVFPDALPFDIPGSDMAPEARPLESCFAPGQTSCTFALSIPEYRRGAMNVSTSTVARGRGRVSTRYSTHLQMLRDENVGSAAREKPVQVAQKNLQLLAENENREGSVLLPCARILKTETGTYVADLAFVPPLVNIHSSDVLRSALRALVELLVTRSTQVSGGRRAKNQSLADFSASDVANFWLLYTINTRLPVLRHLLETPVVAPETLFRELSDLAGSLTSFSPRIAPRDLPQYQHEDPGPPFRQLDAMIRTMLETVVPSNFIALPLKQIRDTVYATALEEDRFVQNTRFYLAVSSDLREPDLIDRAPKLMKISSAAQIENLVRHALPGLRLVHVAQPPRALPVKLRHQYFAVEQSGQFWDQVRQSRSFAVYAPADFLNPQLELIILLPNAG